MCKINGYEVDILGTKIRFQHKVKAAVYRKPYAYILLRVPSDYKYGSLFCWDNENQLLLWVSEPKDIIRKKHPGVRSNGIYDDIYFEGASLIASSGTGRVCRINTITGVIEEEYKKADLALGA